MVDDAYIDFAGSGTSASIGSWVESGFLTPDGFFVFTSEIRLGSGPTATFGQALLRVAVPEPTTLGPWLLLAWTCLRRRRRSA